MEEAGSSGVGLGPPCPGTLAPKGRGGTGTSLKEKSPTKPRAGGWVKGLSDSTLPGSFSLYYWAVSDTSKAKFKRNTLQLESKSARKISPGAVR